jgi:LSD1 subclass zinc finger protein
MVRPAVRGYAVEATDAKYVQCSCGQVLAVPSNATHVRCPNCGAALQPGVSRGPERGMGAGSGPPDSTNEEDNGWVA